jgi:glutaminyl-peptide cyclotransferase
MGDPGSRRSRVAGAAVLVLTALAVASYAGAGDAGSRAPRFDAAAAWRFLTWQVALGPRPAGSPASRRLAARLRRDLPNGRYQAVPGGLRNVIGRVPGRDPRRIVVVGAHYDTKDLPGFVGANDGASGVAVVRQLARGFRPREARSTLVFALFDGEESPRGTPETERDFLRYGVRGSRVAARAFRGARAMVLLDMVGDRDLQVGREASSSPLLWRRLRAAATRVGTAAHFPLLQEPVVLDDQTPFEREGVPAIDVIDFTFACWHQPCDDLHAVSRASLAAVGKTMTELLRTL